MISINDSFKAKWIKFPAGENQVVVSEDFDRFYKDPKITCNWESPEDTEKICLLKNALDNIGWGDKVTLEMPYMPYSRQDRITEKGASFALKVFANTINSLGFQKVITYDAHSVATDLLFDRIENVYPTLWLQKILREENLIDCIIAPDAGASKKIYEILSGMPESVKNGLRVVQANKQRNVVTGDITGIEIEFEKIDEKHCLVLDDICDGGRTFIELSKAMRFSGRFDVQLAVTHGIFSKGREELNKHYSKIHVFNNMEKK